MTTTLETTALIGAFLILLFVIVWFWQSKPDYKRYKTEKRRRKQMFDEGDIYNN